VCRSVSQVLFTPWKIQFLGSWPKNLGEHHLDPQKAHPCAFWLFESSLVQISRAVLCDQCAWRRIQKRTRDTETASFWCSHRPPTLSYQTQLWYAGWHLSCNERWRHTVAEPTSKSQSALKKFHKKKYEKTSETNAVVSAKLRWVRLSVTWYMSRDTACCSQHVVLLQCNVTFGTVRDTPTFVVSRCTKCRRHWWCRRRLSVVTHAQINDSWILVSFLPRDAMHKRDLCCCAMSTPF